MRGDRRREGVVLVFEALPNCQQPNASIASGKQLPLSSTISPRSATGLGCRPEGTREKVGCVDVPTNPTIDPVGLPNAGGELARRLSHYRHARAPPPN